MDCQPHKKLPAGECWRNGRIESDKVILVVILLFKSCHWSVRTLL